MNKIFGKLAFFLLLIALMSSAVAPVNAVTPSVGVSDGDSFDFAVEKYTSTDPLAIGVYLGSDGGSVYAQEGDEFSITFVDATVYED